MGSVKINGWMLVIGAVVFAWLFGLVNIPNIGALTDNADSLSIAQGVATAQVGVSSLSAGNLKDLSDTQKVITLTSADLNSQNTTLLTFNIDLVRTDTNPDVNNAYPIFKVKGEGATSKEVNGVKYYTVEYLSDKKVYNFTFDTQTAEFSNKYGLNVALPQGAGASKSVSISIPSTAELNNFAENIGDTQELMKVKVYNNAGQVQGEVVIRYTRTA